MGRVRKIARFYREHPLSSAFVLLWVASSICKVSVWTGTQAVLGFSSGQLLLAWMPTFIAQANPAEVEFLPGWWEGWEQFERLKVWGSASSALGSLTGMVYLPAWLLIALPRVRSAYRTIRSMRGVVGIPCALCGYDLSGGSSVCPECGDDAPAVRPTKRAIVRREFQTFSRLVIAPVGVMALMALTSAMLYE